MSKCPEYQPPFAYFGGKSRVAEVVWSRLGAVDSYTEPFFGSGAVLFRRPDWHDWSNRREQVNDADGYIANFWRAVRAKPDEVAEWADWPCNENDLTARHIWLVNRRDGLRERLEGDPDYFDAKIAGWWVWGMAWWIGGGWCSGNGPWNTDGERITRTESAGARRQLPQISRDGVGVNRQHESGPDVCSAYTVGIRDYIRKISNRLRRVRVCCGDWSRLVTPCASSYNSSEDSACVGLFLDPPYSLEAGRNMDCYSTDCGSVAHDVREWCREAGKDSRLRIALCGYESEHDELESLGWSVFQWRSSGRDKTASGETRGKDNTKRERIWFSPSCLDPSRGFGLFAE